MHRGSRRSLHEQSAYDNRPVTSDFVKKLFKMLEDPSFEHAISWSAEGDSFDITDVNEFTNSLLPRMFNHSNFASFVRQLNKYNFHKLRKYDDVFAEPRCTYRHPDFRAGRPDLLIKIRRQLSTEQKHQPSAHSSPHDDERNSASPSATSPSPPPSSTALLQSQVDRLIKVQEEMTKHIENLERNYAELVTRLPTVPEVQTQPNNASTSNARPQEQMQFPPDLGLIDPTFGGDSAFGFPIGEGWAEALTGMSAMADPSAATAFAEVPTLSDTDTIMSSSIYPGDSNTSCPQLPPVTDEQYAIVLQNLLGGQFAQGAQPVTGESIQNGELLPCRGMKRALEDLEDVGDWKRVMFGEI